MDVSQSIPELVAAALVTAQASQDKIAEIHAGADDQNDDLLAATIAIEQAAIDIFSVFEARMQHNFKRGPFSRKLKAALLDAGQPDLADRVHQHYLAINVLKHGTGASYRELLNNKSTLFTVKPTSALPEDSEQVSTGLIDVTLPGFFDRLTITLLDAYHFLEKK